MAAKYYIPYCVRPSFLQDNENNASTCGLVNGIVYSFIFTVLIVLASIKFYRDEKDKDKKNNIVTITVIFLFVLWIFTPLSLWSGEKNVWNGHQQTIKSLMNDGFTKKEALSFIAGIKEPGIQINTAQGLPPMIFTKDLEEKTKERKDSK